MKKKRTAVVGAGWFGMAHIRNFNELSNLVSVCDVDQTKLEILKNNHQYDDINLYTDVNTMIKNEDIDAASIVIPPKYIPEIAEKFASKGIDILIEKPMALNIEGLNILKEYDNVRIMPGFIELYNPVFDKLLEHLSEIGEIISIASKRVGLYPRRNWQMGVILDLSIHDIYLQERVMGVDKEIISATGIKKCFKDSIHTDAAFIILDFGDAIGNIESNWLTPSKFRRMYVNGENGGIMIDFISQKINIRRGIELKGEKPATKEIIFTPLRADEPLKREILNFLYDKDPLISLDDGIRALKIALKIENN
ncbi:MAG: Gfo/Idh/MocA family protein [Promethearchaeota archaeon]